MWKNLVSSALLPWRGPWLSPALFAAVSGLRSVAEILSSGQPLLVMLRSGAAARVTASMGLEGPSPLWAGQNGVMCWLLLLQGA